MKIYNTYDPQLLSHILSFKKFTSLSEKERKQVTENRRKLFNSEKSSKEVLKSKVLYDLLFNKKIKKLGNLEIQHYDDHVVVDRGIYKHNTGEKS
jgi:hypothetical protein